jgi:hypothetical protein
MRMNDAMRRLAEQADLDSVTSADLPPGWDEIVVEGWVREPDGGVVSRALSAGYRGSGHFDVTSREAAVNGRAVRDDDLAQNAPDRAAVLVRRGYAVARALLVQAADLDPRPRITAFLTVGPTMTEPPYWAGHLTFWSAHDGEAPYHVLDDVANDVAALVLTTDP